MQTTNEVIGYRVLSGAQFVHTNFRTTWLSYEQPTPISKSDAYRRVAAFVDEHPDQQEHFGDPTVVPVYRVLTPLECTARELGSLLTSLTERHGLRLGLSGDQIEKRIAKELEELGASPVMDRINGVLGR